MGSRNNTKDKPLQLDNCLKISVPDHCPQRANSILVTVLQTQLTNHETLHTRIAQKILRVSRLKRLFLTDLIEADNIEGT